MSDTHKVMTALILVMFAFKNVVVEIHCTLIEMLRFGENEVDHSRWFAVPVETI